MGFILPAFPNLPQHQMTIVIDDLVYLVTFTWRDRSKSWYVDFSNSEGVPLIVGRKLSPGWSPVRGIVVEGMPTGEFYVRGSPGYKMEDFGTTLRLTYYPRDEIAEESITVGLSFSDDEVEYDPVEPPDFCELMEQYRVAMGACFFVYACDDLFIGYNPLDAWMNEAPSEVSLNYDLPQGDPSKIFVFEDGDKKYVRTDEGGYLTSNNYTHSGEDGCRIFLAFVIRNVPPVSREVFRLGDNTTRFYVEANADQTLSINGVAGTIPYELDKVIMIFAHCENGVTPSFVIVDDTGYNSSIDLYDTYQEDIFLGEDGDANGLLLDSICVIWDAYTDFGEGIDYKLTETRVLQISQAIADQYGYTGGMNEGINYPDPP